MSEKILGRNEPCPCGSGKKYKRCCGKDAAPKLGAPMDMSKRLADAAGGANPMAGFDPSQLDPQWVNQISQAMSRLPRGQLQRMQALMQKAMSGRDVSREAAEFERMMPPEFIEMMKNSPMAQAMMQQQAAGALPAPQESAMSVDEARRLVEEAANKGEITSDQAQALLKDASNGSSGEARSGKLSKLWKSLTGKP